MIEECVSKAKLAGKIQTVLGLISPDSLGVTLTHEHLFGDLTVAASDYEPTEPEEKELFFAPVSLENLWWINYHMCSNRDNLILRDEEVAIREASFYKQAGGNSIVDVTNDNFGRDPLALTRVSRATGLNIIMGSGYYIARSHDPDMDHRTEDDICEEIVRDITTGVGDTGVRAGIIGEIGCTSPLANNERKSLRAAARAQLRTGAPMTIHPARNPNPDIAGSLEVIAILSKAGADLSHTIMCHIDRTLRDAEQRRILAETGCYLEYDIFGWEGYHQMPTVDLPNDNHRVNEIIRLIEQGHLDQILISQDICWKSRLRRYGGHGYDHIMRNVVPLMRLKGMSEEQINAILVENPKRLLCFKQCPKEERN